jgi:hypothetical protein
LIELFQNYRQLQISGDIETYKQWVFQFKSSLCDAFQEWIPKAGATALNLGVAELRDEFEFLRNWDIPEFKIVNLVS